MSVHIIYYIQYIYMYAEILSSAVVCNLRQENLVNKQTVKIL